MSEVAKAADAMFPGRAQCVEHHGQIQKLELRVGHMEDCLGEVRGTVRDVKGSVHAIELQIAKQNGTLPRIEETVAAISARLNADEKLGAVNSAVAKTENRLRDRVTWTLIGGIFMALLGITLKLVL